MDNSLIMLIVLSLFLGCGCWLIFLWAVHKGEFNDIERPKHRMLEDDDAPCGAQDVPRASMANTYEKCDNGCEENAQ